MGALANPIELVLGLVIVVAIAVMLLWVIVFRPRQASRRRAIHPTAGRPTIVVAVDGSDESDRALDLACGLAADKHAMLILANVIVLPLRYALDAAPPPLDHLAELALESAAAHARARGVASESRIVKDRAIARGLVQLARETKANIVVVGFDGSLQKGLADLAVISDLFRHAPCEVVVSREPVEPDQGVRPRGRLIEPSLRS